MIISVLLCYIHIVAMETSPKDARDQLFSIVSADEKKILLLYKHARHMEVFFPFHENRCVFLSRHNATAIKKLLKFVEKIDDKTIKPSYFPIKYICDINPTKIKMSLDKYKNFDHNLAQNASDQETIELMSLAREFRDEQLALVLTSFFMDKKYHNNMFAALMPCAQLLSFQGKIDKICKSIYEPRFKEGEDFTDCLAVINKIGQKGIANSSRTLVAFIDDETKNCITIKKNGGKIETVLGGHDKESFSNPTFSGDDLRFACIQNIQDSDCNNFILFVWNVTTWKLFTRVLFSSIGNVQNMSLNHTGTRLVASVQVKELLSPEAENYTFRYENIIIDIGNKKAEIFEHIPAKGIDSILYWRSDGTFVTSSDPRIFYQWSVKKRSGNDKDLNFLQMIFLYALYEREQAVESPIIPLFSGYVKEYIVESLSERLSNWAEEVQDKYQFTS